MRATHGENDCLLLLRALCQSADASLVHRACRLLVRYPWPPGEPRVLFESCSALCARGARISRTNLAAEATRAGFPDVDLDSLFAPLPSPDGELQRWLATLEKEPG